MSPLAKLLRNPFKFVLWLRAQKEMKKTQTNITQVSACLFLKVGTNY